MASNLRFIIAALKINTNLERMGDLSVNIAHCARSLIDAPAVEPIVDIPLIAGLVKSMVRKSLDAFVAGDAELAAQVLLSDDAVDSLRTACFLQLVAFMEKDPRKCPAGRQSSGCHAHSGAAGGSFDEYCRGCPVLCQGNRCPASFGAGLEHGTGLILMR